MNQFLNSPVIFSRLEYFVLRSRKNEVPGTADQFFPRCCHEELLYLIYPVLLEAKKTKLSKDSYADGLEMLARRHIMTQFKPTTLNNHDHLHCAGTRGAAKDFGTHD